MSPNTTANHPLLSAAFEQRTDRQTSTVVRDGNSVRLMPSGSESYASRWELIDGARRCIDLVSFSVMRDETSFRMRDALLGKLRQGVAVRFIVDDAVLHTSFSGGIMKDLTKAGAEVVQYHKIFRDFMPDFRRPRRVHQLVTNIKYKLKRRFHEKFMVVDGSSAILGGINWGDKYAFGGVKPKAWRDTDCSLTGPVVADVQRQFIKSFFFYRALDAEYAARKQPGFDRDAFFAAARAEEDAFIEANREVYFPPLPPTGTDRIRYLPHKPYDESRLPITEAYLMMFREAQQYIYWGCHGVRTPRIVAETLVEAVNRGVDVRLITNSRKSSQTLMARGLLGSMYKECATYFRWLVERGVKIYEWQKPGAFHSKNLVIDGVVGSVGSYNIAEGSTFHHTESNVVVYGGNFPEAVRAQFEVDLQDCREIPLAETKIPSPKKNPFCQPLHQRYLLLDRALLTDSIRTELDNTHFPSN